MVQTYLDGELDLDKAQVVASHLGRCERCGPDAELLEAVRDALAGLAVPVDPVVLERLEALLHDLAQNDSSR
jgi:anti-sigma factor RsiW